MTDKILIIDDEQDILDLMEMSLARLGFESDVADRVKPGIEKLSKGKYALCITDMRLPDGTGMDVVRAVSEKAPGTPVVVITAHGSQENAVEAMKLGAFDYLSKPLSLDALKNLMKTVMGSQKDRRVSSRPSAKNRILGDSPALESVRSMITKVAKSQAPVHIHGESGSGKELAARMIHEMSPRVHGPFIAINCGAIPETLVESELFGYKKGAFTGAAADRDGVFQSASGGTLFLDEVADLPLSMQVKLLRAIQERKVRRVGSHEEESVDVRIVSATHKNLKTLVAEGKFRQDLFYRLDVLSVRMPALRECKSDFPLFVRHLLTEISAREGGGLLSVSADGMKTLSNYDFPGNFRELENVLEYAVAMSDGESVEIDESRFADSDKLPVRVSGEDGTLQDRLDDFERAEIMAALEKTKGNRTEAARRLGITFRAMRYKLVKLGIVKDDGEES